MEQSENMEIVNPNRDWVVSEFEKLYAEWLAWEKQVAGIVDQPYDRNSESAVFADGKDMMLRHEVLQVKTLAFLNNNVRGHGFIRGFNGQHIDRTDLRLKIRVEHRMRDLAVLRGALLAGYADSEAQKAVRETTERPGDEMQPRTKREKWSLTDKLTLMGVMLAALAIVAAVTIPEIRNFFRLPNGAAAAPTAAGRNLSISSVSMKEYMAHRYGGDRFLEHEEFFHSMVGQRISWTGYVLSVHDLSAKEVAMSLSEAPKKEAHAGFIVIAFPAKYRTVLYALHGDDKLSVTGIVAGSGMQYIEGESFKREIATEQ
jgi:hypothetical protein